MAVAGCRWCAFWLQVEPYYKDDRMVIVRDIDSGEYRMRVLAVWREHRPAGSLGAEEMRHLRDRLIYVMETVLQLRPEHYEINGSACFDRRHEHIWGCVL